MQTTVITTLKSEMLKEMEEAYKEGLGFGVDIKNLDLPKDESIINPNENLPGKIKYYEKAYNDNLQLIANPDIIIIHFYKMNIEE